MIRNSHPPIALRSATPVERPQRTAAAPSVYGAGFWGCYLSNTMLMLAVSLLFRYADFVSHVGGSERHLGVIVGVGMIGALAMRITLGMGIDRYGARPIWLGSLLLFIVASLAHTIIYSVHGPTVYLVRILMTIGVTGAVGASLTYVSLRVPENRVAEIVGTLGTSGFLGLALGPVLGDLLFSSTTVDRWQIDRMFILAAAASVVALLAAAVATGGQVRRAGQRRVTGSAASGEAVSPGCHPAGRLRRRDGARATRRLRSRLRRRSQSARDSDLLPGLCGGCHLRPRGDATPDRFYRRASGGLDGDDRPDLEHVAISDGPANMAARVSGHGSRYRTRLAVSSDCRGRYNVIPLPLPRPGHNTGTRHVRYRQPDWPAGHWQYAVLRRTVWASQVPDDVCRGRAGDDAGGPGVRLYVAQ